MEKDKKKKLKFPCIFGGEEMLRHRNSQSCSLANPTTKHDWINVQVRKNNSKQRNDKTTLLAKAKKRPTSMLAKLIGRDKLYSARPIHKQEIRLPDTMEQQNVYEDLEASHLANLSHSLQPCTRMKKHINAMMTTQEDGDELISGSNITESNRQLKDSDSDLMLDLLHKPDPLFVKHLHDQQDTPSSSLGNVRHIVNNKLQKEAEETRAFQDPLAHLSNKPSRRKLERRLVFDSDIPQQKIVISKPNVSNDNCGDETLHISRTVSPSESDMITMISRITINKNDRLTHSLSNLSEPSLFMETNNKMLERWHTTRTEGHVEKDDKEVGLVDLKHVFVSPAGLGICRNGLLPSFNNKNHKMEVYHEDDTDENKSPVESLMPMYDVDNGTSNKEFSPDAVTSCEIQVSSESVSGLASEYSGSIQQIDLSSQSSLTDVPSSEDVLSGPDNCFVKIDSRFTELQRELHLFVLKSKSASISLTFPPMVRQQSSLAVPDSVTLETKFMTHILKTPEKYGYDLDTFSSSWKTIHHPKDPRLLPCMTKFYLKGTISSSSEQSLRYDYIEETFFRTSKSMVAYPWVNPVKRESQMTLNQLKTKDQMLKVINEIEKEGAEEFIALSYEKDPEWLYQTNEIDNLGKSIAEVVLNDLVLEVIRF